MHPTSHAARSLRLSFAAVLAVGALLSTSTATATATAPVAGDTFVVATAPLIDRLWLDYDVVASGFASPVFVASRPGDERLYVVERAGRIISVLPDGSERTTVLDIRSLVESGGGEQGLLGAAFSPADASRLFVYYSVKNTGASRIAEYAFPSASSTATTPAVGTLLTVSQPSSNHNGGMLAFGPDGFLYVGLGDGGGVGDPWDNGQDPDTLLGSILRLDVSSSPYGIPAGNPFDGDDGAEEVWAYGLRNPWRFSFDGADLWIADVGQGRREEVTVLDSANDAGANLGWNVMEGSLCYPSGSPCDASSLGMIGPRLEYGHSGGRCSITGGYVYRGSVSPDLAGHYVYGDFCTGEVFLATADSSPAQTRTFPGIGSPLTSFGQGSDGEIYTVSYDGAIRHLTAVASTFSDVGPGHPFIGPIEWVADQGIAEGYDGGQFKPLDPVSRQAMAAFLYRAAGSPLYDEPAEPSFTDVPTTHPFYLEIEWLASTGVTEGYDDGTFGPASAVSRQAMAAFLRRTAGEPEFTAPEEPNFDDVGQGHPFYLEIEWLFAEGIAEGYSDGGFHPASNVSRQAMAAFLFRLLSED